MPSFPWEGLRGGYAEWIQDQPEPPECITPGCHEEATTGLRCEEHDPR